MSRSKRSPSQSRCCCSAPVSSASARDGGAIAVSAVKPLSNAWPVTSMARLTIQFSKPHDNLALANPCALEWALFLLDLLVYELLHQRPHAHEPLVSRQSAFVPAPITPGCSINVVTRIAHAAAPC